MYGRCLEWKCGLVTFRRTERLGTLHQRNNLADQTVYIRVCTCIEDMPKQFALISLSADLEGKLTSSKRPVNDPSDASMIERYIGEHVYILCVLDR